MSDLTEKEQTNVRTAIRFLRARTGGYEPLVKGLRFQQMTIANVLGGKAVTANMAFRVARLAGVGIDELLAGKYPPAGTCPYCGHTSQVESKP